MRSIHTNGTGERSMDLRGQNDREMVAAIELMFDGVAHVDRNGCILNCDAKIESLCLSIDSKGRQINTEDLELFEKEPSILFSAVQRSIIEQKLIILEEMHLTRDLFFECRIAPLGEGALVVLSDVTVRKLARERLAESERSKAMVLANLPGMAY